MDSVFVCVLGLTLSLVVLSLVYQISKSTKSVAISDGLPPGNTGWPIIGESLSYVLNPQKFVRDRTSRHSPDVFVTSFAGEKMAVFCGPAANKFIFSNEAKLFASWLPGFLAKGLPTIVSDSPTWKLVMDQIHKFLRLESMQHYVSLMDAKAREHLEAHWVPYDQVKNNWRLENPKKKGSY